MKITVPNIAIPEVTYTFECLLQEFLGLKYELIISDFEKNFEIDLDGKKIVIKNSFFKDDDPNKLYQLRNIPSEIDEDIIKVNGKEFLISSIFGEAKLDRNDKKIIIYADIIGSTFFMLTRWEEMVGKERDAHNRFVGERSLAHRCSFLERPIVNEYVELLWELLTQLNIKQKRKHREFTTVPTHDVDHPVLFRNKWATIKEIFRPIIKIFTISDGIDYFKSFIKGDDPFYTHDIFMDLAEEAGVKAHFFFIQGGPHKFDPKDLLKHQKTQGLINEIKERKHRIGFHPSYESYNNLKLHREEKEKIEKGCGFQVTTGRQHFLRFEVPATWRVWEESGMEWDSTLGYPSLPGFRCGVCYRFPVFDVERRRKLKLFELPLIVMEMTLVQYLKLPVKEAKEKVHNLMLNVKKYEGEFVFLWHNSSITPAKFKPYLPVLKQMYSNLSNQ